MKTLVRYLAWSLGLAVVAFLIASMLWPESAPPQRPLAEAPVERMPQPANPMRNAYFGELHLHTTYSLDSGLFGTRIDPREAYRFAMGEAVWLPESETWQRLRAPLDFAAVTDHAESLGTYGQCNDESSENYWSLTCLGLRLKLKLMFKRLVGAYKQEGAQTGRYDAAVCGDDGELCKNSARNIWQDIQGAANEYNSPGTFTTFVGFEYSPTLESAGMLHRNVIFRSDDVPGNVFSALDGLAEDLLRWLQQNCRGNCQALSIPHNPNFSWGLMFGDSNSDGTPLTRANLELRASLERLVEVFQVKGNSECALGMGNADEECSFESLWPVCSDEQARVESATGQHAPRCVGPNDSVRQALKRGLVAQQQWGFNPYKLGMVAATDNHNGTPGDTAEDTWNGHGGEVDSTPGYRLGIDSNMVADTLGFPLTAMNPGGLTGVWAAENTREAIFDAMYRRETFATSGSRIRVRLFAGFDYSADLHQQVTMLETAYASGVPMGGDLSAGKGGAVPRLLLQAQRDADSAPLAMIQVVKGWLQDGETREQVYDVACSDGLEPDPLSHQCPDNGATVNLADCSISSDRGAADLATTWTDPDFDPGEPSFYYARVLENPSCRWSQYDANRLGVPHPEDFPASTRQRAWTSPVWYNP